MAKPAQLQPQKTLQKTKPKRVIITRRHEEILQAVHKLRYVTAMDISRLFYSPTSINHVREILSLLAGKRDYAESQYLFRFPLPDTRIGNPEKIYTLGSKGRSYLQSQNITVDWYFRPYKVSAMTYQPLKHALTLTSFLVAAQVFCKKTVWELRELRTEYELKQEIAEEKAKQKIVTVAVSIETNEGKAEENVTVIPDAWLDFYNAKNKKEPRQPVFLEIDRGSEVQKFFKRQVRARALFLTNGGYKKLFGTSKGVIAYATTGNESRLNCMRMWTHQVLDELKMKKLAVHFRFCRLTLSWEQEESNLFLAPLWVKPLDKHPVPLLW